MKQSESFSALQSLISPLQEVLAVPPGLRDSKKVIAISSDLVALAIDINVKERLMSKSTEDNDTAYAGIICSDHGKVDLTVDEYDEQIIKDGVWVCPKCGKPSGFDDERFEDLHPDSIDPPNED